jgi:hypothetical protein
MSKCRRLVPFGLELAQQFNSGSSHDLHRVAAFSMLDSVYSQMYQGPDFFTEAESAKFMRTVDAFLAHQNWLHQYGVGENNAVYSRTIKSHMLWHMARDSQFYNPRLGWTYNDEDFVGKELVYGLAPNPNRSLPTI